MDINAKLRKENEERVAEEYLSSLSDLTCNSKPLINMLTMLAEENIEYAPVIVKVVEDHIAKVEPEFKLPLLYLVDSIVKNVKSTYIQLFGQCIVSIFCGAFEMVNEKVRERMYSLRQTWNEVFPAQRLYALDVKVKRMDQNWPITAKQSQPSIHVNPNFLKTVSGTQTMPTQMEEILHAKTRELLELKKRKLELELEATKKHLEEQTKQLSGATEVCPPVEVVVSASSLPPGIAPHSMSAPIVPGMITAGFMPPQPPIQPMVPVGVASDVHTGVYQHNFRTPRPQSQHLMSVQSYAHAPPINTMNKPKVHPVNPALLSTVRHRDPRLARQQQQQQQQKQQQQQQQQQIQSMQSGRQLHPARNISIITEDSKARAKSSSPSSYRSRNNKSSRHIDGGTGSNSRPPSKSPTRRPSFSSRSSERSNKHNNRDKDKEKDKGRKRSESKSSSSSTGSITSNRRRNHSSRLNNCDKDAFEIEPLSAVFKRKSSSPTTSPRRTKEFKRNSKSRNRIRSRSRSPKLPHFRTSRSPEHLPKLAADVVYPKEASKTTKNATKDLDKNMKLMLGTAQMPSLAMDVDLRQLPSSSAIKEDKYVDSPIEATCTKSEIPSPHKVSFKITKSFNKIEKSTEHLSTASSAAKSVDNVSSTSSLGAKNNDGSAENKPVSGGESHDGKKAEKDKSGERRPLVASEEQPLPKKSKPSKIDALFGNEDVDLRASNDEPTPPPPPIISEDKRAAQSKLENLDNLKTTKSTTGIVTKTSPKKPATLDDVRAKLAKTARQNKLARNDKPNKEVLDSFKAEVPNMNDDTQEANDEKIRTIISQAQELLQMNSISQEQYQTLVRTVMSLNETSKLEEAKRLDSLGSANTNQSVAEEEVGVDAERMAAREAVLKKRIPRLTKDQISANDQKSSESPLSDGNAVNSPIYDERSELADDGSVSKSRFGNKDTRNKTQKWSERGDVGNMGLSGGKGPTTVSPQRPWGNKRGIAFQGSVPHPPLPPMPNPNLRLPQLQLPWQIGTGIQPLPFAPAMPLLRPTVPPPPQPPSALPLPPIVPVAPSLPKPCNSIDNPQADLVRTITIDGMAKEIRIYDQIAIVFMDLDQPREIGFQPGKRSIAIDNLEPLTLEFNDDYKPITIDGELHRIRFGFPSRELYIDEHWYEIFFGGPPVSIPIKNKHHVLKAEGPPPQVNIGPLRRDLVVGKINMIVDAIIVIPLFLDAKVQSFRLDDKEHTVQFADNLLTVLLDGEADTVEYGGLPKSYKLGDTKYFIRFSTLPQGVVAGKVQIKGMVYVKTSPPHDEKSEVETKTSSINIEEPTDAEIAPTESVNTEDEVKAEEDKTVNEVQTSAVTEVIAHVKSIPIFPAANLSLDELFQKLVTSGILGSTTPASTVITPQATTEPLISTASEVPNETINPIDLWRSETIKTRQSAIIASIYSGMQCGSCGVRFPPEQTIRYSQHLDWHFRQNRRERDSTRKAHSRKWYYDLADWMQYEEIEDFEEREKNFFESQQNEPEAIDDVSNQRSTHSPVPTCAAGPDDVDRTCDMCHEKFEQFYNEELEEWHLRSAVRIDDKIYHPLCYEDYKTSLIPTTAAKEDTKENKNLIDGDNDNAVDIIIKIEGDGDDNPEEKSKISAVTIDDDDDDVIVLPNEEPSVTEIDDDDDEYVPVNVTREEMATGHDNTKSEEVSMNDATESDVEIQEPHIPFTDLDTYEEKELPESDDITHMAYKNVKIKEEPTDDDEDDGFEDVGTVVGAPDEEISIHSSEETQTQMIESSASPATDRPISPTSLVQQDANEGVEEVTTDVNIGLDGNLDAENEHNLSTAGPALAVPLGSLVNKIKINITKNIIPTNCSSAATIGKAAATTPFSINSNETSRANSMQTVSAIPVLCGGGTNAAASVNDSSGGNGGAQTADEASVSSISVIGSYGTASSTSRYQHHKPTPAPPIRQPTPPIEETITYEVKPSLQKAALKKMKKVECGVETSGLCSIM